MTKYPEQERRKSDLQELQLTRGLGDLLRLVWLP